MNTPIPTSRPVERAVVGLVIFVCAGLVLLAAVHLYFHIAPVEKTAPIKGASK